MVLGEDGNIEILTQKFINQKLNKVRKNGMITPQFFEKLISVFSFCHILLNQFANCVIQIFHMYRHKFDSKNSPTIIFFN